MDEADIRMALDAIEKMLRDPTCQVSMSNGFIRRPNYETNYMEHVPTGGRTIKITVRGGGVTRDEDPNVSTMRLIADLRR